MSSRTGTSLLFAAVAAICFIQVVQGLHETVEKCMKETGTTEAEVTEFAEGKDPSHNFKCMVKCCMQTHDLVSDDGTLNRDKIVGALPPKYTDWLTGCLNKPSSKPDPCEKTFDFNHCLMEANPEFFASLTEVEND